MIIIIMIKWKKNECDIWAYVSFVGSKIINFWSSLFVAINILWEQE